MKTREHKTIEGFTPTPIRKTELVWGFTSIELLVSIGIAFLLVVLSLASFINLRTNASLNGTAQEILSNLKLAQARTVASDAQKSYGIRFSAASYIVFPAPFDGGNTLNQTFTLPSSLQIVDAGLTGWPDVVFDRITGKTGNYGSLQVEKIGGTEARIIKIDPSGNVYSSTTSYADSGATTLLDSRHVHVDYSRMIVTSPSETIDLYFDGSGSPQTQVNVASNLDGSNHVNYEGTTVVGGENQTIKIHTHILNNGANSQFSIIRDKSKNTKSLTIKLSGDAGTLVSYLANGTETIGSSIWASNVARQ